MYIRTIIAPEISTLQCIKKLYRGRNTESSEIELSVSGL